VKRTKPRDPAQGIAAAVPPLKRAIAECVGAWTARFERVPTARELIEAFEVVLAAAADELVEDAAAASATFLPKAASRRPLSPTDPSQISVKLGAWYGLDRVELTLAAPRSGELKCVLEPAGDIVLVDYWRTSAYPNPTDEETRLYLARHAIPAWRARRQLGPFARARFRAFDSLVDPIELALR
jgi:hypothetical protein